MKETQYKIGGRRSNGRPDSEFDDGLHDGGFYSDGLCRKIPDGWHLTIALLSDFHNGGPAVVAAVTDSLRRNQPDMIAIAGDLLVGYRPKSDELIVSAQENVLPLVRACADIAPTYISLVDSPSGSINT